MRVNFTPQLSACPGRRDAWGTVKQSVTVVDNPGPGQLPRHPWPAPHPANTGRGADRDDLGPHAGRLEDGPGSDARPSGEIQGRCWPAAQSLDQPGCGMGMAEARHGRQLVLVEGALARQGGRAPGGIPRYQSRRPVTGLGAAAHQGATCGDRSFTETVMERGPQVMSPPAPRCSTPAN